MVQIQGCEKRFYSWHPEKQREEKNGVTQIQKKTSCWWDQKDVLMIRNFRTLYIEFPKIFLVRVLGLM